MKTIAGKIIVASILVSSLHSVHAQQVDSALVPRVIATLQVKDEMSISRVDTQPQFEIVGSSSDGKTLFVKAQRVRAARGKGAFYQLGYSLYDVNTQNGQARLIADLDAVSGVDWLLHPKLLNANSAKSVVLPAATQPLATLLPPLQSVPANDGFKLGPPVKLNPTLPSSLVYTEKVVEQKPDLHWANYAVIRKLGEITNKSTATVYPLESKMVISNPHYSPDGHLIAMNVGDAGDRYSTFQIYIWNPDKNYFVKGPGERVSYLNSKWSPDSKQIAYVVGGDIEGQLANQNDSLKLFVFDLTSGKGHQVATLQGTVDFEWTPEGKLLYSALSEGSQHPAIYEVSSEGGQAKKVVAQGYQPHSSPDGKWLAYVAWTKSADLTPASTAQVANNDGGKSEIFLVDRLIGERKLLAEFPQNAVLKWTTDAQTLLVGKTAYKSSTGEGTFSLSEIKAIM